MDAGDECVHGQGVSGEEDGTAGRVGGRGAEFVLLIRRQQVRGGDEQSGVGAGRRAWWLRHHHRSAEALVPHGNAPVTETGRLCPAVVSWKPAVGALRVNCFSSDFGL